MPNDVKLIKLCTTASVVTALTLISIKFYAWFATDSVSILSSLMDSSMDLIVSVINFAAIRYSMKPADDDHAFGHGKAQDLAALAEALFITLLAFIIGIEAVGRFMNPEKMEMGTVGMLVMGISIVMTVALVSLQSYTYRRTKNDLIKADATHYLTDILTNIAVFISVYATSRLDIEILDPIIGGLIAIYIFRSAVQVGKTAFDNLMDKEFDTVQRARIMTIASSHPQVIRIKGLKTRSGGQNSFIQFEFTMNGEATLNEAHKVAHEIETCLLGEFPEAEIFIHQEPEETI
jgi:ferrous-iron efflux pump FieF